jgi:hypothetical protein
VPSSLSCLVLPARIHSHELASPCQARIGVCNTRHAHKARPTWPGDHEALVDAWRLPCLIPLPALSPWMFISITWSSAPLMPCTPSCCPLGGSRWPSFLIGPGATSTPPTRLSETTSVNTWNLYDLLVPLVSRVVVADPTQVKVIAASFVKTDKRDTLALAKLLAANLIPEVWVPPVDVRDLRALIAHRQRLVEQCTMAKNRLQSLLHRHNLAAPAIDPFGAKHRAWWETLDLSASQRLRMRAASGGDCRTRALD